MKAGYLLLGLIPILLAASCGGDDSSQAIPLTSTVAEIPSPATATPGPSSITPPPGPLTVTVGDHITIKTIGVDAPLVLQVVGTDGRFDGTGPQVVDIYDLSALKGLGGRPGQGNTVVAGWPQPGAGSFTRLTELTRGDEVQLVLGGQVYNYGAVIVCRAPIADFEKLLRSTDVEVLTLLQAGNGNADRNYVVAERKPGSVPIACPAGNPL